MRLPNRTVPSWVSDPVYGEVLKLDGTSGYASTPKSVVDTTASFTVAGWANLSSTGHNAEIVSQDGTQNSEFTLQYDQADNRWAFGMAASDTAGASTVRAMSTSVPATGTWTHLVGTYNAITHVLSLYVNVLPAGGLLIPELRIRPVRSRRRSRRLTDFGTGQACV